MGLLAATASVLAHTVLLLLLTRVQSDRLLQKEPGYLRFEITLRPPQMPQGPLVQDAPPPSPSAPPAIETPSPPPAEDAPPPPVGAVVLAPSEEHPDPEAPDDAPGAPGTGNEPHKEPEGSPGPPAVLGVGASPPAGDGHGLGGDGIGDGSGSRTRGKAGALRRYGGTGATEDAVSRGLQWLAAHQDLDGGWSAAGFNLHCHHFTQCAGKGLEEFNTGLTALCALAFLGAGQAPGGPGPYGRIVERALLKIVSGQLPNGALGLRGDKYFYNHAIATFALCEAVSYGRDARFVKPAVAAIGFSAAAQQSGGGWDYTATATGRNDLSITLWQVMAFKAAEAGGLPVPEEMMQRLRQFLRSVIRPGGEAVYADRGIAEGRRGVGMSAAALLSHLYIGASPKSPWVAEAADRILRNPPDPAKVPEWDTSFQSSNYWYSATLCLFHLGGTRWEAWNHFLQKTLLPGQSMASHEEGSWPPDGNWLGAMGGRIFTTAMNILTLEVYYRYPPLHVYGKK